MYLQTISFFPIKQFSVSSSLALIIFLSCSKAVASTSMVELINEITPSVVGIGIFTPLEAKNPQLLGTGFVTGNGSYIVTNYHVVARELRLDIVQNYVAMAGEGQRMKVLKLELLAIDPVHDLAILSMSEKLPALKLAERNLKPAGTDVFFTGFPIGAVLGLYPATHRGMIAAVAPDINPARNANQLTIDMLKRLNKPFMIYQLDATAYPGNSGSPVFEVQSGEVIAIINKVFVQAGKEAALTNPSGISYAIPVAQLKALAQKNDIEL
ncbi:S1 family peptidase [Ningiella sp. W23]|uniref:S1 family peptidase n=1 Tax=Ningiella sp. W23 TaxID=3023715 RepID=UPI003757961C